MTRDVDYIEIERIVYIWARYAGTRDDTKEGKHYNVNEIKNLIARLERFMKNPDSFNEGFEKEEDDPNREQDEESFEEKEQKISENFDKTIDELGSIL